MVLCGLPVALVHLESGLSRRISLLIFACADDLVGFLLVHVTGHLLSDYVFLDVAVLVLEACLLEHAAEELLQLGVVLKLTLARLGHDLLVHLGGGRALVVVVLQFGFLFFCQTGLGKKSG